MLINTCARYCARVVSYYARLDSYPARVDSCSARLRLLAIHSAPNTAHTITRRMSSKAPSKKPVPPTPTSGGGKKAVAAVTAAPAANGTANKPVEPEDLSGIPTVLKYGILGLISLLAFSIRLFAVVRYESVIHEFDPYFNFRTTKFLAHEGKKDEAVFFQTITVDNSMHA